MSNNHAAGVPASPLFLHDGEEDAQNNAELIEYWRSVLKHKWSIIGLALSGTALAAAISFAMTPVYTSAATILFEPDKARMVSFEDIYAGNRASGREDFFTQFQIIRSREVIQKAIKKARLWEHPLYAPGQPEESILSRLGITSQPSTKTAEDKPLSEDQLVASIYPRVGWGVAVESVAGSRLASISFMSPDAALSASFANAVAETYIDNDLEARFQLTRKAGSWLQEQLVSVKEKLNKSEKALQEFREREGLVDIKGTAQSGSGQQVQDVMGKLIEARIRRMEAENAFKQIREAGQGGDLSALPAISKNPSVEQAKSEEAAASRKLSELSQRYGREHPKYVQAASELESAKVNLRRQIDVVASTVKREYELARNIEAGLEGVLSAARGTVKSINRKEGDLTILEREVEANRQMYDAFFNRISKASGDLELQTPIARVIEPAMVPGAPIKPNKNKNIALGFLLGAFLGVLLALLRDRLDNTLKTSEDVESKLKQPILTTLPLLSEEEVARTKTARIFLDQPKSIYAEAIRTARTGVLLTGLDLPRRIVLVTSSVPGEGKTTFSINLAMAHAHTKKTLLIDADMRRPAISKGLEIQPGARGLSNFVSGNASLVECLQPVEGSTLMLMPSGSVPPNPLELLLSQRFKDALAELGNIFEVIIIDSPPVELVSDAMVLSSFANGVIYVTKAEGTPFPLVRKGIQRVRRGGGQILGVVLNQFDVQRAERYYGNYSGYGKYGYGTNGYQGAYGQAYGEDPK